MWKLTHDKLPYSYNSLRDAFSLDTDILFPKQYACLKPKHLPGLVWFGTADHERKPSLLWHNTDLALSPE